MKDTNFQKVSCCICDTSELKHYGIHYKGSEIVQCKRCHLRFVSRFPPQTVLLEKVYSDITYGRRFDSLADVPFSNDFLNYLDAIEKVKREKGLILDVGTGSGIFLVQAQRRGWKAEGTEISPGQVDYLRKNLGLTVHFGSLEEIDLPKNHYDVISLNQVMEHLFNPKITLLKCKEILKPDGIIYTALPNTGGLNDRIYDLISRYRLTPKPYKHLTDNGHYWFFTLSTLKFLFERVGLETIYLRSTFNPRRLRNPIRRLYAKFGLGSWLEAVVKTK